MTSRKKAATPTKKKASKKAVKKTATKKVTKKTISKKSSTKKKPVNKKGSTTKKKAATNAPKPVKSTKKAAIPGKKATHKTAMGTGLETKPKKPIKEKAVENVIEANLPPVEERSPAVQTSLPVMPTANIKSMQKAAVRNYDNHHLRLSSVRKGGIKPTGKKPLW